MNTKILLLGASSFIGYSLAHFFSSSRNHLKLSYDLTGTYHNHKPPLPVTISLLKLDATNPLSVLELLESQNPDIIINCIALADPNACEENPLLCQKLNLELTQIIATYYLMKKMNKKSAKKRKEFPKYIFFSSSNVFDGVQTEPYTEKAMPSPINHYGSCKAHAEKIAATFPNYAIIRPTMVFGIPQSFQRSNLFMRFFQNLQQQQPIYGNINVYRNPCYIEDIPLLVEKIVTLPKNGIFHAGGRDNVTIYEFAKRIADAFQFSQQLVHQISPFEPKTPKNGILNCQWTEQTVPFQFSTLTQSFEQIKKLGFKK